MAFPPEADRHVQRMSEYEWNLVFAAEVRHPVPGEDALDRNTHIRQKWRNDFQE